MTEHISNDYEVSSEGCVRHWEIPYARLVDATPTPSNPAQVITILPGTALQGTILTVDAVASVAVIDFTCSMVYNHPVRNVLTYNPGVAELTFGPINIGDPVYYDASVSMVAGTYLSTSPLMTTNAVNAVFGFIVPIDAVDQALYPKGAALVGSTHQCGVMQVGAGR